MGLLLVACSGNEVLEQKQSEVNQESPKLNPLVVPPWETFVEAGPGAENELDLETLNGPQAAEPTPPPETAAADEPVAPQPEPEPAPTPAKKPEPAKPGQTVIAAVAVPPVQGAKGEGNAELTAAMRSSLKKAGWPVLEAPRKDALTVQGKVAISPAQGDNQAVKIIWDVTSPDGKRLGDLKQDNAVPAGSLDQSWGENATFAADAAAEGIFELIKKFR
jgi:hypothetical protein